MHSKYTNLTQIRVKNITHIHKRGSQIRSGEDDTRKTQKRDMDKNKSQKKKNYGKNLNLNYQETRITYSDLKKKDAQQYKHQYRINCDFVQR